MKRTQIQLDERTYEALRRRAFKKGCSISALVRELLAHSLKTGKTKKRPSIKDFAFIGAGRSRQGRLSPVSERHDEALEEALMKEHRR
ncbi:MAG: ribbon-helix-helix protein, CopG family [candidate division NC10 bacterium]|nr:ribbon-helix-helix protein, CopG family [candidate division NC10 bacterium]